MELATAVLLPCPLLRRHEATDTTAWLRAPEAELERFGDKPRVVLAHGSVRGFTAQAEDGEAGAPVNYIDLSALPEDSFDYLALGDWHGTKQVAAKAWYAGTPELDRFPRGAGNEPGHILIVKASRRAVPAVTPMRTARLGWHQVALAFADDSGLARLEEQIESIIGTRAQQDLLALELRGSLGIEAANRLVEKIEAWQARLLRLELDDQTLIAPSLAEIEVLTQRSSDPLIARVAAQLVTTATGDGEDAACARIALRELHAACR